jgi:hypothetical protein
MLMTKIQCQLASTSSPPIGGPIAAPTPPSAAQAPIAAERCAGAKVGRTRPSDVGVIAAAPTACTTRAATSNSTVGASAQRAEPATKSARPARKTRSRPTRSPSLPNGTSNAAKTIAYALRTHESPDTDAPAKSSCSAGKAMLTMKRSRLTTKTAAEITAKPRQGEGGCVMGRAT